MDKLLSFSYIIAASFAVWVAVFIGATSGVHVSRKSLMTTFWICVTMFVVCSVISGFIVFN